MTGQPLAQIHGYDPGIAPNGLFWTIPIPDDSVRFTLFKSSLQLTSLSINDAMTNKNSILGGATVPATITSLDIRWNVREQIHDATNGFEGTFIEMTAQTEWSVTQSATSPTNSDGFQFVSDPGSTSKSLFALTGHERNGVFFS